MIVAISRGGFYGPGSPNTAAEHLESYLRTVFGFIGVTDLEFIAADGVQVGPEHRERALKGALEAASQLRAAAQASRALREAGVIAGAFAGMEPIGWGARKGKGNKAVGPGSGSSAGAANHQAIGGDQRERQHERDHGQQRPPARRRRCR